VISGRREPPDWAHSRQIMPASLICAPEMEPTPMMRPQPAQNSCFTSNRVPRIGDTWNAVLPTTMVSPAPASTVSSMRLPFTFTPLDDPRSVTSSRPLRYSNWQWRREARLSPSR
jgi:hypothetical protein